jgi:hypothetical protein
MADSNTLFLLVSYTVFVSVLQNILFTKTTILILEFVHFCIVFAKDDSSATMRSFHSSGGKSHPAAEYASEQTRLPH